MDRLKPIPKNITDKLMRAVIINDTTESKSNVAAPVQFQQRSAPAIVLDPQLNNYILSKAFKKSEVSNAQNDLQ